MPEVTLNPRNQCTLDDPTDGADLQSAALSPDAPSGAPSGPPPLPPWLAQEPEAGGASSEGTGELVRQFGGDDGAGLPTPAPEPERSCTLDWLAAAGNCGKLGAELVGLLAAKKAPSGAGLDPFAALSCASSLGQAIECELGE